MAVELNFLFLKGVQLIMKNSKRFLAISIASIAMLSLFASCDKKDDTNVETAEPAVETEEATITEDAEDAEEALDEDTDTSDASEDDTTSADSEATK